MTDKKFEVFAAIMISCVGVFFVFGMPFLLGVLFLSWGSVNLKPT